MVGSDCAKLTLLPPLTTSGNVHHFTAQNFMSIWVVLIGRMCDQTRSLSICLEKFSVQEFSPQNLHLIFSRAPNLKRLEFRGSHQIGWNDFPVNQLQHLLFQGCLLALESSATSANNPKHSTSFQLVITPLAGWTNEIIFWLHHFGFLSKCLANHAPRK